MVLFWARRILSWIGCLLVHEPISKFPTGNSCTQGNNAKNSLQLTFSVVLVRIHLIETLLTRMFFVLTEFSSHRFLLSSVRILMLGNLPSSQERIVFQLLTRPQASARLALISLKFSTRCRFWLQVLKNHTRQMVFLRNVACNCGTSQTLCIFKLDS